MNKAFITILFIIVYQSVDAQQDVRVMNYNLLQYGNPCQVPLASKDVWLSSILSYYRPDILTVNEMAPNIAYANRIVQRAFTYTNDITYGELTNEANSSIINMIFYNQTIFGYAGGEVIGGSVRDINVYKLYYLPSVLEGDTTYLYCIVAHLKASDGATNQMLRNNSAKSIMSWIDANARDKNILMMGDFNTGVYTEDAFRTFIANDDAIIRLRDPAGPQNGWGPGNSEILTQSTRGNSPDCGSGGGLDDRFDFILASRAIMEGSQKVAYLAGSYASLGNDGRTFNTELKCNGNTVVPDIVCNNLIQMSDHLPVVMQLGFTTVDIPTILFRDLDIRINNPFEGEIHITFGGKKKLPSNLDLQILDISGRILKREKLSSLNREHHIMLNVSPGMYMVRLTDQGGRVWTKKLIRK